MTTPPPVNQPAPARSFGPVARLVRRWLGVDDQRRDFDALGTTLEMKDQLVDGQRRQLEKHAEVIAKLNERIQGAVSIAVRVNDRLAWHERSALARSRQQYELAVAKEKARREDYIAEHPELSEAEASEYRATGKLRKAES